MTEPLTGILPIAPTPFHEDGQVDEEGMARVLDCMIDQGVDAICILANYSEQFLLSDAERALLMRLCLEHIAGRVPVIVTISHFSTDLVVGRAREAQDAINRFISAVAGDLPGFEEANRALYRSDAKRFAEETASWPRDIRRYLEHWEEAAWS